VNLFPGYRFFLLLAGSLSLSVSHSEERILSFKSEIAIAADATMTVEETIRVRAEGVNIRRGIYRDFPTDYKDALGNRYVVDFEVLKVTRDGRPEPWQTKRRSNGVRVYAGSADTFLPNGDYSYTIRYRTDRQIGYFDDRDELYWNVTGNGWAFVMDEVSATVTLPIVVPANDIAVEGYTGRSGGRGQNYSTDVRDGGASIRSTRALNNSEGLTLVIGWPKGIVAEPSTPQRIGYVLQDNRGILLSLVTLLIAATYLYVAWSRYGRDPEPGVIFPHYEPPKGYSPASARYISKMGYDSNALSAAVINLAVKGYLSIIKRDNEYLLQKKSSTEKLARGESVLLKGLFADGPVVELDNQNHALIGAARSVHEEALKRDYKNIYFFKNTGLLMPSLIGSLLMLAAIGLLGAMAPIVVFLFVLNIALHGLFVYLMKAPTPKGRLLLDKLEGFRMYLEVAEKDDLDYRYPPEKTPELFERYLPFAVSLGVEQAWAEQFAKVFAELEAKQGVSYQPNWYDGSFSYMGLADFADNVGSGFTSAISSAATPPGSSSGSGGGGSSGGGGGGGGGGGW
jgi:uncharacterized membrane protein YgcG